MSPLEYVLHSTIITSRSQNNCSQNLIIIEGIGERTSRRCGKIGEKTERDFFSIERMIFTSVEKFANSCQRGETLCGHR